MFNRADTIFLKFREGNAYYYSNKELFLDVLPFEIVIIHHLISDDKFEHDKDSLVIVPWDKIPASYKLDACSMNPFIRKNTNEYPYVANPFIRWIGRIVMRWCVR